MRDQLDAEHTVGMLAHLVQRTRQFDPAGLATAAGMDLRLDDPQVATQLFGSLDRRSRRLGRKATRHGNAEGRE